MELKTLQRSSVTVQEPERVTVILGDWFDSPGTGKLLSLALLSTRLLCGPGLLYVDKRTPISQQCDRLGGPAPSAALR